MKMRAGGVGDEKARDAPRKLAVIAAGTLPSTRKKTSQSAVMTAMPAARVVHIVQEVEGIGDAHYPDERRKMRPASW
jgi:hypothetical protein